MSSNGLTVIPTRLLKCVGLMNSPNNSETVEDWHKSAKCHHCGKKGHIRPNCPNRSDDSDSDDETEKEKKSKARRAADKKKKSQKATFVDFLLVESCHLINL